MPWSTWRGWDSYAGEMGESIGKEAEDKVEKLLEPYELPEGKSRPEIYGRNEYQPLLSTQLGKLYMLKGHRFYRDNYEKISLHIKIL